MGQVEDKEYEKWQREFRENLTSDEEKVAFDTLSKAEAAEKLFKAPSFREKKFYTVLNDLNSRKRELEEWYETNKPINEGLKAEKEALLKERDELRAQLGTGGNPPPAANVAKSQPGVSQEDFEGMRQKVDLMDKALPKLLGQWGTIVKTIAEERYDLDPQEVIDYSIQHRVDPYKAFEDLTYDERKKRFDSDRKKELDSAREEGRRKALGERSSPDVHRASGPSAVDILRSSDSSKALTDPSQRKADAVKEFLETDWSKADLATRTGL